MPRTTFAFACASLSLAAAVAGVTMGGCGKSSTEPDPQRNVYWVNPNGSEVNFKLTHIEPQVPF